MILDLIGDNDSFEDVRGKTQKGILEIMRSVNKLGANLLFAQNSRTTQSVTSTSYVDLTEFKTQTTTSGGIVIFFASLYTIFTAINTSLKLVIDGEDKREILTGISAGDFVSYPFFVWVGALPAGSHVFKMQAKVNGGTAIYGATTHDSTIYAVELMRG